MARSALCLIGLAVAFGLGACGSSDESSSKSSSEPSPTASPSATESSNNRGGY